MPQNVEIKAKVQDINDLIIRAKKISQEDGAVLHQKDIFYNCSNGRLKLRSITTPKEEIVHQLIYYQRPDKTGPKLSDYAITSVDDPEGMDRILSASIGRKGMVIKKRTLFIVGQTRVHIDQIKGLGDFMELEVVMKNAQSSEEGASIAHDLMAKLGIEPRNLVTGAYHDLLISKQRQTNS